MSVVDGDFLLGDVVFGVELGKLGGVGGDLVEEFGAHKIHGHECVTILEIALLVSLVAVVLGQFGILTNFNNAVVDNVDSDLLLGSSFINEFRHCLKVFLYHIADTGRVCNFEKNIVNSTNL